MEEIKSPLPPRTTDLPPEAAETAPVEKEESNVGRVSMPIETKRRGIGLEIAIIVGILIIIGLVFGVVLPRIRGGGGSSKQTEIVYWGLWEDSSIMEGVIADFEAKNPNVKIKYKKNSRENYRTRLKARLGKSETGEEVPDIFRIHATWLGGFAEELETVPGAVAGELQLDSDYYGVFKRELADKKGWRAVPLMYDGLAMFYNKELVESAGVNLPKTWWGLEGAATRLTVKDEVTGKIKVAGAALGLTGNVDHWSDIVGLMLKQNGVDLMKNDTINDSKLKDVLTYYTLFANKHGVWDTSLPSSTEFFANGKLAFYFGPSWRVFNIEEMNPSLKFETTGVPQLPTAEGAPIDQLENTGENLTNINWASYWVEGVNSRSKNKAAAWKFLSYLASKEGLERLYQTAKQVRSFGEIYPRKSMAGLLSGDKKTKAWISAAETANSWYLASRTFDNGINDEMMKYFENAINRINSGAGGETTTITELRNGIQQLGQKYGIK